MHVHLRTYSARFYYSNSVWEWDHTKGKCLKFGWKWSGHGWTSRTGSGASPTAQNMTLPPFWASGTRLHTCLLGTLAMLLLQFSYIHNLKSIQIKSQSPEAANIFVQLWSACVLYTPVSCLTLCCKQIYACTDQITCTGMVFTFLCVLTFFVTYMRWLFNVSHTYIVN